MRIVYMGTPEFALPALQQIHASPHEIVGIVSGPDRPVGRGRKLTSPPVAHAGRALGYQVLQPDSLKDEHFHRALERLDADLFVVVAFRILPTIVLGIPKAGAINLHPSLLPRYRGPAPIHHSLLNGDAVTGITTILLTAQVDAGNILLQERLDILPQEDFGALSTRLAAEGARLILATINELEKGDLVPRPQSDPGLPAPSKAPKITADQGRIDWHSPAEVIANQIRAFSPKPGAYTSYQDTRLKLFDPAPIPGHAPPGVIAHTEGDFLVIGTGVGNLAAGSVQIAGKRRLPWIEFQRGNPLEKGVILG